MAKVTAQDRFEYAGTEYTVGQEFDITDAEDLRILLGFNKITLAADGSGERRGRYKRRDMRAEEALT